MPESFVSFEEAMKILGTDTEGIAVLVGSKRLTNYGSGGEVQFDRDEVERAALEQAEPIPFQLENRGRSCGHWTGLRAATLDRSLKIILNRLGDNAEPLCVSINLDRTGNLSKAVAQAMVDAVNKWQDEQGQ